MKSGCFRLRKRSARNKSALWSRAKEQGHAGIWISRRLLRVGYTGFDAAVPPPRCKYVSLGTASGEGTRVLRFGCLERVRLLPPRQNVAPRGHRNSFETRWAIS